MKNEMQVSAGILIVGLGGNNGVTLLAGQLANKHGLEWETLTGRKYPREGYTEALATRVVSRALPAPPGP